MDLSTIGVFIVAAAALLIVPGPAVLYIMARSIGQGTKAGVVSVLGVALGGAVHVVFGAVGISAILMTSAAAFTMIKYLGAVYLIYLGGQNVIFCFHRIFIILFHCVTGFHAEGRISTRLSATSGWRWRMVMNRSSRWEARKTTRRMKEKSCIKMTWEPYAAAGIGGKPNERCSPNRRSARFFASNRLMKQGMRFFTKRWKNWLPPYAVISGAQ